NADAGRADVPVETDDATWLAVRREGANREPSEPAAVPDVGSTAVQIVRTIPNDVYDRVPRGDFRLLESYTRALRSAERLVYLESQFLWSPELVSVLAEKLRDPPADEFRLVVLLPAHPMNGPEDTRGQLG